MAGGLNSARCTISSMVTLIDDAELCERLEALPQRTGRHRAIAALADQPGGRGRDPRPVPDLSAVRRDPLPRGLQGVRVLVVDDDPETLELFAVALEACGADVATASSAPAALAHVAAHPVDVVVSDIAMPGADGYWLVR